MTSTEMWNLKVMLDKGEPVPPYTLRKLAAAIEQVQEENETLRAELAALRKQVK